MDETGIQRARERDIPDIAGLNNLFAPDGLTLIRTEAFVAAHLDGYLILRDAEEQLIGCVALDEYSPSLVELVSLAVAPSAQGRGLGRELIEAACMLATRRDYPQIFAISLADALFLSMGFVDSNIAHFPEKIARYTKISRSELSIGKKFCFVRDLSERGQRNDQPVDDHHGAEQHDRHQHFIKA
ncbi:MAG: GNAT family N-acetyltransferase [Gemmatimonadota bacterium]|nr:GNAT family N-acetyltransferase [Gemmatimonadota bacterium]